MKAKSLLVAACALFAAACVMPSASSLSSTQIGLRTAPLNDEKDVKIQDINWTKEPAGMAKRFDRSYENAPPLIPHDTEGLLPITKDNNMCVTCHMPEFAKDSGATPIPESHFYDLATHKNLGKLNDSRFNCTQCHVPQANTKPLVGNSFKPDFRNPNSKERSNLLDVINEGVK